MSPFDLYGPAEMAEMTASGVGENTARPEVLDHEPLYCPVRPDAKYSERLARAYEERGYPKCAATVRALNREQKS